MKYFILGVVILLCLSTPVHTQQTPEVVKINTELVQTGVTVIDKQGRFVDGLKKEDFELRVNGRSVPISFFENIVAGTSRDRLLRNNSSSIKDTQLSYRQRTVVFFVDDRHLSLGSLEPTRKLLLNFIDKEMGQNDLVAIASSSGQIGFLQQFTDNKDVLRAAVRRLNPIPYAITDYGKNSGSPMTEYMALTIERKDDSNVFDFFVRDCQKWAPPGVTKTDRASMRRHCEIEVQNRARQILVQAGNVTAATYYSLETLLQSAQRMPGSKLAFFVSDGFLADTGPRGPTASNQLERITDEARRGGVVIYTVDARGLVSGALDATGSVPMDPDGRLENAKTRQITAAQDALDNLAANTGGRALRNQNTFDNFVSDALAETSRYYLIAWRPEANESKTELLKQIQLSIVGHPELTVRSSRGYVSNTSRASIDNAPISEKKPETALKEALNDFYPKADLPVQLSVIYLDTPDNGLVLTSSVQAPAELLSYGEQNNEPAQLSIAGVVLNDQGKPAASFKTSLKVNPSTSSKVIYNQPSPLKPGIYQVRVAARDDRSGTIGSAMQWLMIPDLSQRQLALSSLIVGLESVGHNVERVQWSIDRKFAPNSQLRFMTFIYNGGADLVALVNVYRDGRAVVSMPAKKVVRNNTSDPNRIPFNSEINLTGLPPGRYILEVRVEDGTTHATAIQQTSFYIE